MAGLDGVTIPTKSCSDVTETSETRKEGAELGSPQRGRMCLLIFFVSMVVVLAILALASAKARLELVAAVEWFEDQPDISVLLYILVSITVISIGFPLVIEEIIAGVIYHIGVAIAVCFTIRVVCILGGQRIGRCLVSDNLDYYSQKRIFIKKLILAVQTNEIKLVAMLRMTWIPFVIQNYVLPSAVQNFLRYVLVSLVAGFPSLIIYVVIGNNAESIIEALEGKAMSDPKNAALTILGAIMVLTVIVFFIYLTRKVKRDIEEVQIECPVHDEEAFSKEDRD